MVDTHSIAHCAAPQAEGIKTAAPLLGHVSSSLLQPRFFVSVIVVPRIRGEKTTEANPSKGEGAAKCWEAKFSFLRFSPRTAVKLLGFPEAFLFGILILY